MLALYDTLMWLALYCIDREAGRCGRVETPPVLETPRPGFSSQKPMSTNATATQESIVVEDRSAPARDHIVVGTDSRGHTHHLIKHDLRLVVVAEDGKVDHAEDWSHVADAGALDGVLAEWIAFVDEKRGWERREYITATEFGSLESGFRTLGEILEGR